MPRLQATSLQSSEVNWGPWSEALNQATQVPMNARATSAVVVDTSGNSLRPPGGPVHHGEEVSEPAGGGLPGAYQVHVDMVESLLRHLERLQRRLNVAVDLRTLEFHTRVHPVSVSQE
ncbi:hypothetical protein AAFF_G00392320 [Aldrovandia affinis]|uniref:Uncharacterized protein n=1 Tax=Aldrovandia affinis TaxID=143900 RepID=A0AAD7SEH8_9TELE|nr:hypothetical protein AAFF_G00392320 [Aldrovandia affinis]